MAANQGAPNTLNRPRWFSSGARAGCEVKYCATPAGLVPSWGSMDPGTLPRASRNSRISAIRIEVSCRQAQRAQPAQPEVGARGPPGRQFVRLGERIGLRRAYVRHQAACPVTLVSMVASSPMVAVPKTAPAMCPVRLITSVVGVPAIGTTAVKSSVITEPASLTLG